MIYLSTGANGAGKTLITLFDVRAQQLAEDRPVYYHGFKPLQPIIDFGWQPFDPRKWQDLPDGSICIFDEAQNEMPASREAIPDWINAIAQFRRARGFDFWIITPHPTMIHPNVRKLIESPSWHRHFKRTFGAEMVSELRFNFAETRCELPGAGKRAQVTMRAYPKQVYTWYQSTTLNTAKRVIPKQLYVLAACLLMVPFLGYLAYQQTIGSKLEQTPPPSTSPAPGGQPSAGASGSGSDEGPDYFASYTPRISGIPHTAPRYDEFTKPQQVPYPAACMSMGKRCECFSTQATRLPVPQDICAQVVAGGYFIEWLPPAASPAVERPSEAANEPTSTISKPSTPAHLIVF
jgi:zona occludens toxin